MLRQWQFFDIGMQYIQCYFPLFLPSAKLVAHAVFDVVVDDEVQFLFRKTIVLRHGSVMTSLADGINEIGETHATDHSGVPSFLSEITVEAICSEIASSASVGLSVRCLKNIISDSSVMSQSLRVQNDPTFFPAFNLN